MTRSFIAVAATLSVAAAVHAQSIADTDFEDQMVGSFPDCPWLDMQDGPAVPGVTLPSCLVIETTGADGLPTRAVQTTEPNGSDGVYAPIPFADRYVLRADVRVDAYDPDADPKGPAGLWAMYVSVSKYLEGIPGGGWPGVGIYASAGTQGWRLYAVGASAEPGFDEIDLEVPATVGVWYHVEVEVFATTGEVRSRILDAATETVLVDRIDVIPNWAPTDGQFDTVALFDGDTDGTPSSSQATIDNISYEVGYPAPTGPAGDLDGDGVVGPADLAILLANWG